MVLPLDSLPVGFRFSPTDEELVNHYLKRKNTGRSSGIEAIPEVDICKFEPWDLPDKSIIRTGDLEWFFFSPMAKKFQNGQRCNRATEAGFWKATGKGRKIKFCSKQIGKKQTLVFYTGRSPKGERTNWIIHEYRANETALKDTDGSQDAFVLCRLFKKSEDKTANPGCNVESPSFDAVGPSGLSLDASKSSPEVNLPLETEDPTIKNKIPDLDIEGGPEHLSAVTNSRDPVDISWPLVGKLLDNGTPDLLTQEDTECSGHMGGPDPDTSGSLDPAFPPLNFYEACVSSNSRSLYDCLNRTGTFDPYRDADVEQDISSMGPRLREQWLYYNDDKFPVESTDEGLFDAQIKIRSGHCKSYSNDVCLQAATVTNFEDNEDEATITNFEDNEDEAEAIEASGSMIEPVHDAVHKRFPEQVVTPPVDSTRRPSRVFQSLEFQMDRSDVSHGQICALHARPSFSSTCRQPHTQADSPPRIAQGAGLGYSSTRRPTPAQADSPLRFISERAQAQGDFQEIAHAQGGSPRLVAQSGRSDDSHPQICALYAEPHFSSTRRQPQTRADSPPWLYARSAGLGYSSTRRPPQALDDSPHRVAQSAGLDCSLTRGPTQVQVDSSPFVAMQGQASWPEPGYSSTRRVYLRGGVQGSSSTHRPPQSQAAVRPLQSVVPNEVTEYSEINLRSRKSSIPKPSRKSIDEVPTLQPAVSNSKAKLHSETRFTVDFGVALFLILALLVTAVWRGFNR